MRTFSRFGFCTSVALLLVASSAAADSTPASSPRSQVIRRGGAPWLFLGAHRTMSPRAAVNAAVPAASRMTLMTTATHRFGDGDRIVRFEQTHQGLPVIGRGATVRMSAAGDAVMTAVDLEENLPATVLPTATRAAAARVAAHHAIFGATENDAHLVIWPLRGGGSRLAWAVVPQVPAGVPSAPRIIVDATTGKVIEARETAVFATAQVFRSNPTKSPQLVTETLALTPTGDTLTNPFLRSTNCIDNKAVKDVNLFGFKAKMHVCDLVQTAKANNEGNFVYAPSDDAGAEASRRDEFSELSMYAHTSKAYAFFRGLQGVEDAQVIVDKPLPVVANLQIPAGIGSGNLAKAADPNTPLETFSNAFFSPAGGGLGQVFSQLYGLSSGALWFGQGPKRDYAYDGDVVYHEFAHAVVDDTLKLEAWHIDARGAVDSPGAMNEGLADYFSSAITGDPDVGEYASKDLSQNLNVIRTLANQDRCPDGIIGEVHADSTLFSGALWQARTSLANDGERTKLDAGIYKAMRSNPGKGDLGYDDLAKLFLATLTTDFPAGASALEAAMKARGVLPSCERIIENGGKAKDQTLGGWTAPGLIALGVGEIAPGILQVHAKVEGSANVTVSFTARKGQSGGGGLPGQGSSTPFTPVVLAKFGAPITWTSSAGKQIAHDADAKVKVSGSSGLLEVSIPVPEGATDVYVQIANEGEDDGTYDGIAVTADIIPTDPVPPVTGPTTTTPVTTTASGCSVTGPVGTSRTQRGVEIFLGIAAALGVVRAKRGKKERA